MLLKFNIEAQIIERTDENIVVANSYNYLAAQFTFSGEWDGLTKTALFRHGEDEPYEALLENDTCWVPHEVIKDDGFVVSVIAGDLITANTAEVLVLPSGYVPGETPPSPSPSIYAQIIAIMEQQAVDAVAAETANVEAEGHATEAERQAGISAGHANTAEQQAGIAAGHAGDALTQANRAEGQADRAEGEADRAESEADRAGNNILNGVATHDSEEGSHPFILSEQSRIEAIARGKANSKVFNTYADMIAWLADPENTATLNIGDNLYIRDLGVPDYWWDGLAAQELEAEAPRLVDYYTKIEVDNRLPIAIEQTDYDALVAAGTVIAGRIYYVVPDGTLGGG